MHKEAEQALILSGSVNAENIHEAKLKSRENRISILLNLLEGRSAEDCRIIAEILAQHYKIPILSLNKIVPPRHIMKQCDPKLSRRLYFLPVAEDGDQLTIGMVDPLDLNYNDEVRAIFQKQIKSVFISMNDFERNYYRFFRKGISLPAENPDLMNTLILKKLFLGEERPETSVDEKDVIAKKFAPIILSKALANKASGFSIEPQQDISLVNISLDGTEYNLFRLSISNHRAMVDAMMRLAKIDPRKHSGVDQFSRCRIKYQGQEYILAYSFRQTPTGEQVIVHILNPRLNDLTIEQLGIPNKSIRHLKQTLEAPGMILVTGPSGSGKSTLLQVLARHATTLNKKVFTIEDIIGLKIEGARQFQIKPQGPSKSEILKVLQEKNVDIIMIDEIDKQTLSAALDAIESGCLVMLSITTPGISEAISMLLRSGASRSRIASALKLVCSHKVIRKLCADCKSTAKTHSTTMSQWQIPENVQFQTANGCEKCNKIGYQGNITLTEQLVINPKIVEMIKQGASGPEVFEAGRLEGTLTLIEHGFNKAIDGATSLEEVLATIPYNEPFPLKSRMRMGRVMPLKKSSNDKKAARNKQASPFAPIEAKVLSTTEGNVSIPFPGLDSVTTEKKVEIIKEKEPAQPVATTPQDAPDADDKANILLVDDSAVTLEFTRHILNVSGYFNVDTVDTAKKALEMLQQKLYHLVITDQEMPGQTGQEFIDSIRQHPSFNSVGTILLTGNLNEISALQGGADGYIAKPTDPEVLIARAKSISDIYKRLSAIAPEKPAAPISMQIPPTTSNATGKIEFTEKDMANISGMELDRPVSTTTGETQAEIETLDGRQDEKAKEDEASSEFDSLFK